jgi:putative peptidoglycan lipid II flippase
MLLTDILSEWEPVVLKKVTEVWKKLTSGSINRQILGSIVTIALGTGLVKVATLAKELFVAWKFGTGDDLDAFLVAFIVPSFVVSIVASSFNAAMIPTYIQVREKEGIKIAQKLFSGVTVWSLGLLVITTILIVVAAPIYLPWIAAGFSAEKLDLTFKLLYAISPFVLFCGISTTWSAVLSAGEHFALVAISPIIFPTITIVFLLLFNSWGVFNLVSGILAGTLLELFFLGLLLHRQGISLLPKWYGFDTHLRQVANQYIPMIAGASLMNSTGLVDQSMAAMLSPGSVAALNYGHRSIAFILSLTATALSTAVIPYFSKMVAHSDWKGIDYTLRRYLLIIFIVTIPIAGFLYLFSEPIIQIIYQRGAFAYQDTITVSRIQSFFAVQIPFYMANILVVKMISALRFNQILMWVSAINFIVNIVLNIVFMKVWGIAGIALSTSIVYIMSFCFTCICCLYLLNKKMKMQQN